MHRDHVPAVPPSFHLLGSTAISANQGMVRLYPGASPEAVSPADVHIFTVQGHPEFNEKIMVVILGARREQGIFDEELYKDSMGRAPLPHDGVVISQAFLRFLLED